MPVSPPPSPPMGHSRRSEEPGYLRRQTPRSRLLSRTRLRTLRGGERDQLFPDDTHRIFVIPESSDPPATVGELGSRLTTLPTASWAFAVCNPRTCLLRAGEKLVADVVSQTRPKRHTFLFFSPAQSIYLGLRVRQTTPASDCSRTACCAKSSNRTGGFISPRMPACYAIPVTAALRSVYRQPSTTLTPRRVQGSVHVLRMIV